MIYTEKVCLERLSAVFKLYQAQAALVLEARRQIFIDMSICLETMIQHSCAKDGTVVKHFINEYMTVVGAIMDTVETLEYGALKTQYQKEIHKQFICKDRTGSWVHAVKEKFPISASSANGLNHYLEPLVRNFVRFLKIFLSGSKPLFFRLKRRKRNPKNVMNNSCKR